MPIPSIILGLLYYDAEDRASDWHIRRDDLMSEAGFALDYGRTSSEWSTGQAADVARAVSAGIRWVLWPHLAPNSGFHEWSWMKPTLTVTTVASTDDYTLPAYFGGLYGGLTYVDSNAYRPINIVSEYDIRRMRQLTSTGYPRYAATRISSAPSAHVQRHTLMLYPTPDSAYEIEGRCQILPNALADTNPWLPGDASMAEVYLSGVRAACERIIRQDESGIETQEFSASLNAAIIRDRRMSTPEFFGSMGGSATEGGPVRVHGWSTTTATYSPPSF